MAVAGSSPRVREYTRHSSSGTFPRGSSPRVRGIHRQPTAQNNYQRFIPACAGNTGSVGNLTATTPGSSPRVRGIPEKVPALAGAARFIPACAGNTPLAESTGWRSAVHPRVCGEYEVGVVLWVKTVRFIPACAGNTTRGSSRAKRKTVHPRVCGEYWTGAFDLSVAARFIPACAGNTSTASSQSLPLPVHPRVCGEYRGFHCFSPTLTGSSPRVRGILGRWGGSPGGWRFIPACAGNTTRSTRKGVSRPVHPRVCGEYPSS